MDLDVDTYLLEHAEIEKQDGMSGRSRPSGDWVSKLTGFGDASLGNNYGSAKQFRVFDLGTSAAEMKSGVPMRF
jgi:hypothetical protein